MTQQFDLAFKTSNSMDKMMSNTTTSSFTSKENQKELGTKFGNFLDDANKSYSKSSNGNETKTRNEISQNKEDKTSFADKKYRDNDVRKSAKSDDKKDVISNESSVKDNNFGTKFEEKSVETVKNDIQNSEVISNESLELEEMELIEEPLKEVLLSLNTLPNVEIDINSDMTANSALKLESTVLFEDDIPADALKSGIKFDAMFTQSENATTEEINTIDALTKDVVASKDDYISAMYKSEKDVVKKDDTLVKNDIRTVDNTDLQKFSEIKPDVVKEDDLLSEQQVVVKEENADKTVNQVKDVQIEKEQNFDKTVIQPTNVEENAVVESKSELQQPKKDNNEITLSSLDDIKEVSVIKNNQIETKVKNEEQPAKTETISDKTEQTVLVQDKSQVAEHQIAETVVAANILKQNVTEEAKAEQPQVKEDILKQEISSAKLENSANLAQNNNSNAKEQTPDEFAKTNVDAKERMNIKDDVKGVEFVNNKFEERQELKTTDNKSAQDVKAENVKHKVEQVKMQVEEDVKVQPQNQRVLSDENKMLRANETLEKAGLSTENLAKMDARIKEVDKSSKTYQTDLGQSSREVLMRDVMQNNASVQNTEAVELKVDFNQELNSKLTQSNNLQMPRPSTEDIPDVNILEQIRAKMALNAQNGVQKITIGLTPESLGKLHIEISKGQNGISAQIVADNPQAKEILDKSLDGLKSVLQSQGVNVNNVNVKVAEAGRSSDSNNNMFNKEDGQFDSNNNGNNSKNQDAEKEKRSGYEFLQNEAMKNEMLDEPEQILERTMQTEKTISVKSGFRNVSYKL